MHIDFQAIISSMIGSLEDSNLAKMDLETKLRKWFKEFYIGSFDIVTICNKLENLLNDETVTKTVLQEADTNQDPKINPKSHRFVKTLGYKQFQQPDNSVLNLCDIFEVCRPFFGQVKVGASYEIENAYFCKIVEFLIKTEHYDVNDKNWDETGLNTPLLLACIINDDPNVKCIEMLLDNGADVNIKIGVTGDTILHQFLMLTKTDNETCLEVIELFIKYGYNINTVSSNGRTLLHICAKCPEHIGLIKPLVQLGANIAVKEAHGREAFQVNYEMGFSQEADVCDELDVCGELLYVGLDVNQRDCNGCTLLMLLVFFRSDISKLSFILQKGCDVNAVDKCGRTALHYVFTGETEYIDYEYINVLIDAGADYLIKDNFHKTAFQYVVYIDQKQQVECLCCIFNQYGQLFSQLDLKLRLNENVLLSRYNRVTKQLTERFSNRNFGSFCSFISKALDVLTEENVFDILYTKGVGATENVHGFQSVQSQVDLVMERLATQLSEDTQLSLKAQLSGSVSEKCKVGLPDEFDYLFIIEGVEKYFNIQPTSTLDFASVQKRTVENFPEEFFYFVNECGYMVPVSFLHYFSQKILEALQRTNIWEGTELYWWKSHDLNFEGNTSSKANFLLNFRYHLTSFNEINIGIDVVAALPIPHNKLKTFLVNCRELDSPKLFVLPTKSENWLYDTLKMRVSTSFIETAIILSLPKYLRNAFMLLKILKEHGKKEELYIDQNYLTTYQLKTVLLHTYSKILESNHSLEQNSDEIKPTIEAARIMIQHYSKFEEDKNMPSYFFKNNLLDHLPSSDSNDDDDDDDDDDVDESIFWGD